MCEPIRETDESETDCPKVSTGIEPGVSGKTSCRRGLRWAPRVKRDEPGSPNPCPPRPTPTPTPVAGETDRNKFLKGALPWASESFAVKV